MKLRWLVVAWVTLLTGMVLILVGKVIYDHYDNQFAQLCRDFGLIPHEGLYDCGGPVSSTLGTVGEVLALGGALLVLVGIVLGVTWTTIEARRRRSA